MKDVTYELWQGEVVMPNGEEVLAVVCCRQGVPGFMVADREMLLPLFEGDEDTQRDAVLAMSMTYEFAREGGHMSTLEWADLLDRQLVAEWMVPEQSLFSIKEEFYKDNPERRPTPRTLH